MEVFINGNRLKLVIGDITEQHTEAIVNAANGALLGGGGVDGAIHRKAGYELVEECKKIRREVLNGALLPIGEAVITKGYNLPAKYVIHTVGPVWNNNTGNKEQLLSNCYRNSLALAKERGMKSLAFPSISTGVFRFPLALAAKLAIREIVEFLELHEFGEVKMVLFSQKDYDAYEEELKQIG